MPLPLSPRTSTGASTFAMRRICHSRYLMGALWPTMGPSTLPSDAGSSAWRSAAWPVGVPERLAQVGERHRLRVVVEEVVEDEFAARRARKRVQLEHADPLEPVVRLQEGVQVLEGPRRRNSWVISSPTRYRCWCSSRCADLRSAAMATSQPASRRWSHTRASSVRGTTHRIFRSRPYHLLPAGTADRRSGVPRGPRLSPSLDTSGPSPGPCHPACPGVSWELPRRSIVPLFVPGVFSVRDRFVTVRR